MIDTKERKHNFRPKAFYSTLKKDNKRFCDKIRQISAGTNNFLFFSHRTGLFFKSSYSKAIENNFVYYEYTLSGDIEGHLTQEAN